MRTPKALKTLGPFILFRDGSGYTIRNTRNSADADRWYTDKAFAIRQMERLCAAIRAANTTKETPA